MSVSSETRAPILGGLKVLDLSHQYSGANASAILADLGADVISIEDPKGSPIRTMLPKKDGESLWWKVAQRGKRAITLKLSTAKGREMFFRLARDCDIIVENFRPGTLERWGIGPADLEREGIAVVLLRISGFGQTGPLKDLPGFGSVAEAISGFAHMNGFPDSPPAFPSTTLADGVASVFGVLGILAGIVNRLRTGHRKVEVVDVALFESLFRIIPTQVAMYDQLGKAPRRPGNYLGEHGVLRNVYRSADDKYLCISSVGPQAIRRVLVGARAPALVERIDAGVMTDPDTATVQAFLSDCNEHLIAWSAARPYAQLSADLAEAGAVHSPVFSMEEIAKDAHYQARGDLIRVPDAQFGSILMQGVVPKFPGREHVITHAGRERGADNEAVYREVVQLSGDELQALKNEGVV